MALQPQFEADVIIVGAGLSGLMAAHVLSRDGDASVTILESSDRLGGRTFAETWTEAGAMVELGGTWLLPQFTEARALLEDLGIGTFVTPEPERALTHFGDGVKERRSLAEEDRATLHDFIGRARQLMDAQPGNSVADVFRVLKPSPVVEGWLAGVQRYLAGGELEAVDGAHLFLDWEELIDPEHYRLEIEGTTAAIVDALVHRLRVSGSSVIHRDCMVTKVAEGDGGVILSTRAGEQYRARRAIIAVPMNTLGDIEFEPRLGGVIGELAAAGHVGLSFKELLLLGNVDRSFRVLSSVGPYGYLRFLRELADGRVLAVGFSESASPSSTPELQDALGQYLPGVVIHARLAHDWVGSPHSRGAWFAPRPDQFRLLPQRRDEGLLHFVGGDLCPDFPGTMEGALRTGAAAGAGVAAQLSASLES